MVKIPGLRSPYARVGPLVYFGRMLDKIRLNAAGQLPASHVANMGDASANFFDGRCCRFLRVEYPAVKAQTLPGSMDAEILAWCFACGGQRSAEECQVWNDFMMKRGWRDDRSEALQQRVMEYGCAGHKIETMFDLLDFDEGRDPVAAKSWLASA